MGWGIPNISCYVYIGETLEQYLTKIKPRTYKYRSNIPTIRHDIIHSMNSIDLDVSVLVQDPLNLTWNDDAVTIKYIDSNTVRVELTESCNVNVIIQLIDL